MANKKMVAFRLSEQTLSRLDEIVIGEAPSDLGLAFLPLKSVLNRTRVLESLINLRFDELQKKKLSPVNTDPITTKKRRKKRCLPAKKDVQIAPKKRMRAKPLTSIPA